MILNKPLLKFGYVSLDFLRNFLLNLLFGIRDLSVHLEVSNLNYVIIVAPLQVNFELAVAQKHNQFGCLPNKDKDGEELIDEEIKVENQDAYAEFPIQRKKPLQLWNTC